MLNLKKNNSEQGFTIIEVMIVLAIAGLIMLIVFLALPALQRGQRNTSRKNDAGRISSSINDFVSNSNGNLPRVDSAAHWQADCKTIMNNAGNMSQFTPSDITCSGAAIGNGGAGLFDAESGSTSALPTIASGNDALVLDEAAVCPTTVGGNPSSGSARQAALFYTVESNGSNTWNCIQSE